MGRAHLREAAKLAQEAGLDEAMANALLVRYRTSFDEDQESDTEKIELLEYLLERLVGPPGLRARLLGMLAEELIFVGDLRRGPLLEDASRLAEESGDPVAFIDVTTSYFDARPRPTWSLEELRHDLEVVTRTHQAALDIGDTPV